MLEQMLQKYEVSSVDQANQALREVMQEIALAGLYRGGFFNKAAFYGETCLRVFYDLSRFSEDLDFSLLMSDENFSLEPYFKAVEAEFLALGIEVEITQKQKGIDTQIESAFLKNSTQVFDIKLDGKQVVKIKFEVDTLPPLGFETEEKLLIEPFSFFVKCFSLPDLFAGKVHALMFRKWENRVKGRDWFDFEWYIRKGVAINLDHFNERALQSNDIKTPLNKEAFMSLLRERVEEVDFNNAKQDVERFIIDVSPLEIWSKDYFFALAEKLNYK